ncbi:MAG: hypothetical protein AB8G99_00790 [Planctomycetaceae bacterium]
MNSPSSTVMLRKTKSKATALLLTTVCVCSSMVGCGDSTAKKAGETKIAGGDIAQTSDTRVQRCQSLFESAITRVRPQNLGISSKSTSAALALNDWFRRCGSDDWQDDWASAAGSLLNERVARRAAADRFSESDALYIRTCLLMRKYAKAVPGRSNSERTLGLFYSVVRDVALRENGVTLTPFEVVMTGRGSAEDRAWVFVEALRQLRIDGFIVEPAEKKEAWLVGASVDDKVMLFDMRLGLPIFKTTDYTDGALPQTGVTLDQLAGDDEILGSMSIEGFDYPATDADFENSMVYLVGGSSTFAQRSLLLQNSLTGEDTTVLCDQIQDTGDGQGLAARVAKAGGWDAADVSLWQYSAENLDGFSRLDEAGQVRLDQLIAPLKARVERTPDGKQLVFSTPHWELFQGRIDQLSGSTTDDVTTQYQKIRLGKMTKETVKRDDRGVKYTVTAPDEFVDLHNRAAEDASFWVTAHQLRAKQYEAAIDGLFTYRRLYADNPAWAGHAEYVLALALAENGDFGKALKYLETAASHDEPHAHGFKVLLANWKRQMPTDTEAKDSKESVPPAKADGEESPKSDADKEESKEDQSDQQQEEAKTDDKKESAAKDEKKPESKPDEKKSNDDNAV